jgi:hypothetical protein
MAEITQELRVAFDLVLDEIQTLDQAVGGHKQESERFRLCCHELVVKIHKLTGAINGNQDANR